MKVIAKLRILKWFDAPFCPSMMQIFMRCFAAFLILASTILCPEASAQVAAPETPVPPPFPMGKFGKQLLVVVAGDWKSVQATLYGFSRRDGASPWQLAFSYPAVLGKNGLGWGLGIHGWILGDGPVKKEGDKRSPAGLFHLPTAFGYASAKEAGITSYPYLQVTENILAVDDPLSPFYNRFVDRRKQDPGKWQSAEVMLRPDGSYRLGLFISHNDPAFRPAKESPENGQSLPIPGAQALGSCIFLHIWKSENSPTIGCTALAPENMAIVARWLRPDSNPLLLQLPLAQYLHFQKAWNLPSLPENPNAKP